MRYFAKRCDFSHDDQTFCKLWLGKNVIFSNKMVWQGSGFSCNDMEPNSSIFETHYVICVYSLKIAFISPSSYVLEKSSGLSGLIARKNSFIN